MESVKELRAICQLPRRHLDGWHMKHIARKFSIYISWVLLHTPVSANGVTFMMVIVGWIACALFALGTRPFFLYGALCLQLWYVMDMVDGEIARYRKQSSLTGIYFDSMSHYLVHPFVFFGIGFGLYKQLGEISCLFLGFIAAYSHCMISVLFDVFNSTLFCEAPRHLIKSAGQSNSGLINDIAESKQSIFKRAFSLIHLLCVFPAAMNILLIVSILDFFMPFNSMVVFIQAYAFISTLVWAARVFVMINSRKMESVLSGMQREKSGG